MKAGDKVSFAWVRPQGSFGIRISSREGTLVTLGPDESTVKFKNGRRALVDTASLRPIGVPDALTECLLKMAQP